MFKNNLRLKFLHQYNKIQNFTNNIYVADYTEKTKNLPVKRSVEFFSPKPPTDNEYFTINNPSSLSIDGIEFDNNSFVYSAGNPKSQCEAVFFPSTSSSTSWVLLCELKYSPRPRYNEVNLRKAIKQLIKTRYNYKQTNVFTSTNTLYLIASLPQQREPFANFSLTARELLDLKRKRNIIMRFKNSVDVVDSDTIVV